MFSDWENLTYLSWAGLVLPLLFTPSPPAPPFLGYTSGEGHCIWKGFHSCQTLKSDVDVHKKFLFFQYTSQLTDHVSLRKYQYEVEICTGNTFLPIWLLKLIYDFIRNRGFVWSVNYLSHDIKRVMLLSLFMKSFH